MANKSEIISDLNHELYERFGEVELCFLYSTSGYYESVLFGDHIIWHSEDDDRQWIEETQDYEPFEPFIKKVFNNWVDKLNSLKF